MGRYFLALEKDGRAGMIGRKGKSLD